MQKVTCVQLAGSWQEDADKLMVWYSGWYNGLAKKHFFHPSRRVRLEHEVRAMWTHEVLSPASVSAGRLSPEPPAGTFGQPC